MTALRFSSAWRWAGPLCIGLLALAVAAIALRLHWDGQAADDARAIEALQQRLRSSQRVQAATSADAGASDRWAALPDAQQQVQRLALLLRAGQGAGLQQGRLEQAVHEMEAPGFERAQVSVAWRGPYVGLRRFLESALRTDAALSLDQLRVSRSAAASTDVEAETTWSLFQRRTGNAQAGTSR